jgi:glycyl-tRNA synthetase
MTDQPNAAAASTSGKKSMDDIVALCKRRGFIFQASEIYGGINGFWDYGPLGAQLKKNLKDAWWHDVVLTPPDGPDGKPISMVGLDSCIIQNPKVWEASGHIGGFNDPMVDDKETKQRFRADHFFGLVVTDNPEHAAFDLSRIREGITRDGYAVVHHTFVAGSLGEARDFLLSNPKVMQKTYGTAAGGEQTASGFSFRYGNNKVGLLFEIPLKETEVYYADIPSPFSGKRGVLTAPRSFNLMFFTYIGATATEDDKAYLRPETAQGIFINYKNVLDTTRVKVPFGIAQIGKAFRNEVTPRNFTFRSREFEQMEIEFFCSPEDTGRWYQFWREWRFNWWRTLGLSSDNLQMREHDRDELAHYAKTGAGTADIEYRFPFTYPGFGELEGVADRSNFDLTQHAQHSGAKLEYFDQEQNKRYMPHVVEPSAGADRGTLALICEAYTPDPSRPSGVVMKFNPRIAPIKAAIFPLVNKDGMPEVGEKLHAELRRKFGNVDYDPKQSIGKRYARMDEAGCPFCFTIDGDTLTDNTVTVRDRDTLEQSRINIAQVSSFLAERLGLDA